MQVKTIIHGVGAAWDQLCNEPGCQRCSGSDRPLEGHGNLAMSLVVNEIDDWGEEVASGQHILIDCGAGCWNGIRRAGLALPDLLLLSHKHPDHLNPMELDTLVRVRRGRDPLRVVTSDVTWAAIPDYLKGQLEFSPISTEFPFTTRFGLEPVTIRAFDTSDHCEGGLGYVVEMGKLRFGALFDVRAWRDEDRPLLENLDLAVIDGDTLEPALNDATHTSIAEGLEFFGTFRRHPRLMLFAHYGHPEFHRLSPGNLVSQLAGLAPELPARIATRGMRIDSRHLPPRKPIASVDCNGTACLALDENDEAMLRTTHAAVAIVARAHPNKMLVHETRTPTRRMWNGPGGKLRPIDRGQPERAALRLIERRFEAHIGDHYPLRLGRRDLVALTPPHALETLRSIGRERVTVFGLTVPPRSHLRWLDRDDEHRDMHGRSFGLSELLEIYGKSPHQFDERLQCVLRAAGNDAQFRAKIEAFLAMED